MFPLFDKDSNLVGWIEPHKHIWDTDMNWVAFITDGHGWSADTGNWMGPVKDLLCLDTDGRVVAWNPKDYVAGVPKPREPVPAARAEEPPRPAMPVKPARLDRPATPLGGWSSLSFHTWTMQ
jgi:hypothetical protein